MKKSEIYILVICKWPLARGQNERSEKSKRKHKESEDSRLLFNEPWSIVLFDYSLVCVETEIFLFIQTLLPQKKISIYPFYKGEVLI